MRSKVEEFGGDLRSKVEGFLAVLKSTSQAVALIVLFIYIFRSISSTRPICKSLAVQIVLKVLELTGQIAELWNKKVIL